MHFESVVGKKIADKSGGLWNKIIIHVIIHNDILMLKPQADKQTNKTDNTALIFFWGKKPFVY